MSIGKKCHWKGFNRILPRNEHFPCAEAIQNIACAGWRIRILKTLSFLSHLDY